MPIDGRIPMMFQMPEMVKPMDLQKDAMGIKSMLKQSELQDAQLKRANQEFDLEAERALAKRKKDAAFSIFDENSYQQVRKMALDEGWPNADKMPQIYDERYVKGVLQPGTLSAEEQFARQDKALDHSLRARQIAATERLANARIAAIDAKAANAGKPKPMTVSQAKQYGLYKQGEAAEEDFQATQNPQGNAIQKWWNQYDPTSSFQFIDNNDWKIPFTDIPIVPPALKSSEALKAQNAQERWVEAYLRDASGAAIPPSERMSYAKDFFPRPGDSQDVVTAKARARQLKMQTAKLAAGAAPEDAYGNPVGQTAGVDNLDDDAIDKLYQELGGE